MSNTTRWLIAGGLCLTAAGLFIWMSQRHEGTRASAPMRGEVSTGAPVRMDAPAQRDSGGPVSTVEVDARPLRPTRAKGDGWVMDTPKTQEELMAGVEVVSGSAIRVNTPLVTAANAPKVAEPKGPPMTPEEILAGQSKNP